MVAREFHGELAEGCTGLLPKGEDSGGCAGTQEVGHCVVVKCKAAATCREVLVCIQNSIRGVRLVGEEATSCGESIINCLEGEFPEFVVREVAELGGWVLEKGFKGLACSMPRVVFPLGVSGYAGGMAVGNVLFVSGFANNLGYGCGGAKEE